MRARDIAEQHLMIEMTTDAYEAAKLMASQAMPGLVVRGDKKHPYTVLPASQVLRFVIPAYVQQDPALARVYPEGAADLMASKLPGRTVADVMPDRADLTTVPRVNDDDTLLEVCAVMAQCHSPIVVVGRGDDIIGVITIRRLLAVLFPDVSPATPVTDLAATDQTATESEHDPA